MDSKLHKGIKGEKNIMVGINDTASRYGSGLIDVYATPAMIGLMETTAQISVQQYLPEEFITLGIEIHVKHLKATPVGQKVSCHTELTDVQERKLTFSLRAFDEEGEIGSGTHVRFIVNKENFLKKLQRP